MASILKLGGSSSISSRTRMPRPRVVIFVVSAVTVVAVVGGAEMRQYRAARRASADDEMESMVLYDIINSVPIT